jgi:hypothetical protein
VLGYDPDPGRGHLGVNAREAVQIREIFGLFQRDGSLDSTLAEMQQRGWQMKSWTTRKGQPHVGQPFDRAALVRLLTNVLYCAIHLHQQTRKTRQAVVGFRRTRAVGSAGPKGGPRQDYSRRRPRRPESENRPAEFQLQKLPGVVIGDRRQ